MEVAKLLASQLCEPRGICMLPTLRVCELIKATAEEEDAQVKKRRKGDWKLRNSIATLKNSQVKNRPVKNKEFLTSE